MTSITPGGDGCYVYGSIISFMIAFARTPNIREEQRRFIIDKTGEANILRGIDLEPASNEVGQQWILAKLYYSEADDGLAQPRQGRIWLNPPCSNQTNLWTEKMITVHEAGDVTQPVILVRPTAGLMPAGIPRRIRSMGMCFSM